MVKNKYWPIMEKELKQIKQKGKPVTYEEFLQACESKGVKYNTFRYNYNHHCGKDFKVKLKNGKRWIVPIEPSEMANWKEIDILLDQIMKEANELAAHNFASLCSKKTVTHHPKVETLFRYTLESDTCKKIQTEILTALKFIIKRAIEKKDDETLNNYYDNNKEIIREFAKTPWVDVKFLENGLPKLVWYPIDSKKEAMTIMALRRDRELLEIIYDIIKFKYGEDEYLELEEHIINKILPYFKEWKLEIMGKLYYIHNQTDYDKIKDRIKRLLSELEKV